MANELITSIAWVTPAKVTASSANANFPATNVLDYLHPNQPWKATAITITENLVFDFSAATSIAAMMIDTINSTSVKVQFNATDSWGAPSVNETVTISQDKLDGRYKVYHAPTGANHRYCRVLNNTTSSTDGSNALRIGAISFFSAVTSWTRNPGYPYGQTPMRAVLRGDDFAGGGREPVTIGNRYTQLTLSQARFGLSAMEATILTVLGYGEGQPFLLYRNFSDTSKVYVVRRVGQLSWQEEGPAHASLQTALLEEVV